MPGADRQCRFANAARSVNQRAPTAVLRRERIFDRFQFFLTPEEVRLVGQFGFALRMVERL